MNRSVPMPFLMGLILICGIAVFLAVLNGWVALSFRQPLESVRPWTWLNAPAVWRAVNPEAFEEALRYALCSGGGLTVALLALALRPEPESPHGDARWATQREIRKAGLVEDLGVIIGKFGGPRAVQPFLRTKREDYSNILLVAPPGAGKGVGVVIPTLLTYPGSTIVLDVKGENFEATARRRVEMGDAVFRFSPYDEQGQTHRFNPLDQARVFKDPDRRFTELRRIASHLLVSKGRSDEPFISGVRELFSALASVALQSTTPTIGEIYRMLSPQGVGDNTGTGTPDMAATLAGLARQANYATARIVLGQFAAYDQKTLSTYLSVLKGTGLNAWGDPAVDRATSGSDFDFSSLRRNPASIYLVIGSNDMETLAPVARLFFQSAIAALQRSMPEKDDHFPVLLVLDEFRSLGRMEAISNAATTLRGYGGRMLIVVQGAPNLEEIYGRAGRDGLMNACQLHAYMSLNDPGTREMVSRSLGTREVRSTSESTSRTTGRMGFSRTRSEQTRAKRLLSEDEIGRLGNDDLLVIAQNLRPIRVRKVRYYSDRKLRKIFRGQSNMPDVEIPDQSKSVLAPLSDDGAVVGTPKELSDSDAEWLANFAKGNAKARDSINASARGGQQKEVVHTQVAGEPIIDIADAQRIAGFVDHIGRVKQEVPTQ